MRATTKAIENETKRQKGRFLWILLGTLGGILLGNMLRGKEILRAGFGNEEGKEILRADYGSKKVFNPTLSFNKYWNAEILSAWT